MSILTHYNNMTVLIDWRLSVLIKRCYLHNLNEMCVQRCLPEYNFVPFLFDRRSDDGRNILMCIRSTQLQLNCHVYILCCFAECRDNERVQLCLLKMTKIIFSIWMGHIWIFYYRRLQEVKITGTLLVLLYFTN